MQTPMTYQKLKKKFSHIENMFPAWFTAAVYRATVKLMQNKGKLHAVKYLCDLSKENGTRDVHDLQWAKQNICDEILPPEQSPVSQLTKEIERLAFTKGYPTVRLSASQYMEILQTAHAHVFG